MDSTSTTTQNPIAAITADNEPPSAAETSSPNPEGEPMTLSEEIASLNSLTTSQLQNKYLEVYGFPTRNRNAATLRKRIAYRLKDKAVGGMSGRLARMLYQAEQEDPGPYRETKALSSEGIIEYTSDPRLPPIGGYLVKEHGGKRYKAKVLPNGFEFEGKYYKSLSGVAKGITGTKWNPAVFWGLKPLKETGSMDNTTGGTEAG